MALLEVLGDVAPAELLASYRAACVAGSALVLSHLTQLTITDEQVEAFRHMMNDTPTPHARFTTRQEMEAIGAGYTWLSPGVVPLEHWRPEAPVADEQAGQANSYGAVGIL